MTTSPTSIPSAKAPAEPVLMTASTLKWSARIATLIADMTLPIPLSTKTSSTEPILPV